MGILLILFTPLSRLSATVIPLQTPKIDNLAASTTKETLPQPRPGQEGAYNREALTRYIGEKVITYGLGSEKYQQLMYTIGKESSWDFKAYNAGDEKYVKGGEPRHKPIYFANLVNVQPDKIN